MMTMHQWPLRRRQGLLGRTAFTSTMRYRVTDRLHTERTVCVPANGIVTTVSAWLEELGTHSPMVDDLARAVCNGDWPAAYAIGERLSVEVTLAA